MITCPTCGTPAAEHDVFCGECGSSLAPTVKTAEGPQSPAAETVLTPPRRPDPPPVSPPPTFITRASETPPPLAPPAPPPGDASPMAPPAGLRDTELLGEAGANEQYLGERLLYRDGEAESLDPLTWRFLKALVVHWFALSIVSSIGVALVYFIGGAINRTFGMVLALLFALVMGVLLWWAPVWVPISEWKFMLDGKSERAWPAFEHITWAFLQRSTPVSPRVQRINLGDGLTREYLVVRDGIFCGYVVSLPYGRDLYVGWTYWWRLSAVRWIWIGLTRAYQHLTLRGSQLHTVHRYDSAKALREAIHGASRQGLDAATGVVEFRGQGTIGSQLKIESVGLARNLSAQLTGRGAGTPPTGG